MAFKKGQGGRPKGASNKTTSATAHILARLGGTDGEVYAQQLVELTSPDKDPHVRLKALSLIVPYVWGKPKETLALEGADGGPVLVQFVDA